MKWSDAHCNRIYLPYGSFPSLAKGSLDITRHLLSVTQISHSPKPSLVGSFAFSFSETTKPFNFWPELSPATLYSIDNSSHNMTLTVTTLQNNYSTFFFILRHENHLHSQNLSILLLALLINRKLQINLTCLTYKLRNTPKAWKSMSRYQFCTLLIMGLIYTETGL